MVALSSSSSSTASSVDSPSYLRLPSLEEILQDAQNNFPRFLFDSEPLAVLELLNSLLIRCSERGYSAVLECLWCWQDLNDFSHSLSPLLDELRCANDVQIVIASLRLLERLLQFSPDRVSRARLRNEMEELHLEEIIIELRERFKFSSELEEPINDWMNALKTQTQVEKVEEEMRTGADADSGTFSESEEIVKVTETGEDMLEFHKLMTEFSDSERNEIVNLFKKLLNRVSNNNNKTNVLNEFITCCTSFLIENETNSNLKNQLISQPEIKINKNTITTTKGLLLPPPPPPPPPLLLIKPSTPKKDISLPPTQAADIPRPLRPKALPGQGRRLRHLQWAKVPSNFVVNSGGEANSSPHQNIWQGLECADRELRDRLDFAGLDSLFGCPSSPPAFYNNNEESPSFNGQKRRRAASLMPNSQQQDYIALLNAKRSLSVNVFLKLYRNPEQLICDISEGKSENIGPDRLRTLMQLLPSEEEKATLCQYKGDLTQLGQAERFLLLLINLPKYKLRIDGMLFRLDIEELIINSGQSYGLETWLKGGEELISSPSLHKILYILLHVGNYLNHGAGIGNAVGFRLSSLWKVEDVKAVGSNVKGRRSTLLHFVAKQANNCSEELMLELENVRESVKTSLEAIKEDLRALIERHRRLDREIKEMKQNEAETNDSFFKEFKQFLEKSGNFLKISEEQLKRLEPLRQKLANFFCEPERTFSIEECFKIIASFIEKFEKAVQENRKWPLDNNEEKITENNLNSNPKIILNDKNSYLFNLNKNSTLEVGEGINKRRNSALPAFMLKNNEAKEENKQNIEIVNIKSLENNNPIVEANIPQKQTIASNVENNNKILQPKNKLELNETKNVVESKLPTCSPALIRISKDAKQHLVDNNNEKKKEEENNNNNNGQVAKRIENYEQKQTIPRVSGICRLSNISRVRTGQMTAIVQAKGNLENNSNNNETFIQRPTPFKRNLTLTPTTCKNLSLKNSGNIDKQKESLQSHKAKLQSLTRAASQQVSSKRQQTTLKSNNSTPVAKSKPVLTRQVSTASRPILIHSSGCGGNNNSNNNSNNSDKKPKWI